MTTLNLQQLQQEAKEADRLAAESLFEAEIAHSEAYVTILKLEYEINERKLNEIRRQRDLRHKKYGAIYA